MSVLQKRNTIVEQFCDIESDDKIKDNCISNLVRIRNNCQEIIFDGMIYVNSTCLDVRLGTVELSCLVTATATFTSLKTH